MYPIFCTYTLHILHVQFSGNHFLILDLNSLRDVDNLISFGIIYQIFGPINESVSVPYLTVRMFLDFDIVP